MDAMSYLTAADIKREMKKKYPKYHYTYKTRKGKGTLGIRPEPPPQEVIEMTEYFHHILANPNQFARFVPLSANPTEFKILKDGKWVKE